MTFPSATRESRAAHKQRMEAGSTLFMEPTQLRALWQLRTSIAMHLLALVWPCTCAKRETTTARQVRLKNCFAVRIPFMEEQERYQTLHLTSQDIFCNRHACGVQKNMDLKCHQM